MPTLEGIHAGVRAILAQRLGSGKTTVKLLSAQTGLSPSTICNFRSGRRRLGRHGLSLVIAALGISLEPCRMEPRE